MSKVNEEWLPLPLIENVVAIIKEFVVGLSPDLETVMVEGDARMTVGITIVIEQWTFDKISQLCEYLGFANFAPLSKCLQWVLYHPEGILPI